MRIPILILRCKGLKLTSRQVSRKVILQLRHKLIQASCCPGQAKHESCFPKGQPGIQVFFFSADDRPPCTFMLNSSKKDELGRGCHRPLMKVKPIKKFSKRQIYTQHMYHIFVCRLSFSHGESQSESEPNKPMSARFVFILSSNYFITY